MKKTVRVLLVVLVVLLGLSLAAGFAYIWARNNNPYTLELTMHGPQEITLEYGERYTEEGASAICYGHWFEKEPVSVQVRQIGAVNDQQVGTYDIRYEASYNGRMGTAYRRVHIIDTEKPQITLLGEDEMYVLPGNTYQEPGYTASDNFDGDLTAKVECELWGGLMIYRVTDSSGNEFREYRVIHYEDKVAPKIQFTGGNTVTVSAGSEFVEPGFTAIDNCDGDVTEKVTVTGSIDPYKTGTYPYTYTVTDTFGNTATVTRNVEVVPMDMDSLPEKNGKYIYLTFDDGPTQYTARLLEILDKYNVKATFFVTNTSRIHMIKDMAANGHKIAIHSASHNVSVIYSSEDAFFSDLYKMQSIIRQYTGENCGLLRFPEGSSNTVSIQYSEGIMTRLTQRVQAEGFRYFDWNVSSGDVKNATTEEAVFQETIRVIQSKNLKHYVVLQHDFLDYSVEATERIIIWGLLNGYTFQVLTSSSPTVHHFLNN